MLLLQKFFENQLKLDNNSNVLTIFLKGFLTSDLTHFYKCFVADLSDGKKAEFGYKDYNYDDDDEQTWAIRTGYFISKFVVHVVVLT